MDSLQIVLSEAGINLLNFTEKSAKELFTFIQTNAPEVLHEWITWNLVTSAIWALIWFILLTITVLWIYNDYKNNWKDSHASEGIVVFVWIVVSLFSIPSFIFEITEVLKITLAPRLWILNNIGGLIK